MELNLSEPGQSRYLRVYEYYKELIVSGQMKPGAKLPSIRKCSLQLQLSRTTVETAYMLLAADGYIISRPQSGFYVTDAVLAAANRFMKDRRSGRHPIILMTSRWLLIRSMRQKQWRRLIMGGV